MDRNRRLNISNDLKIRTLVLKTSVFKIDLTTQAELLFGLFLFQFLFVGHIIENLGNAPIFKSVTVYLGHEIELWKDNAWFIPHYQ